MAEKSGGYVLTTYIQESADPPSGDQKNPGYLDLPRGAKWFGKRMSINHRPLFFFFLHPGWKVLVDVFFFSNDIFHICKWVPYWLHHASIFFQKHVVNWGTGLPFRSSSGLLLHDVWSWNFQYEWEAGLPWTLGLAPSRQRFGEKPCGFFHLSRLKPLRESTRRVIFSWRNP